MEQFKRAKVVMLSTNEKATIGDLVLSKHVLNFAKNNDWINIYNPIKQHIYIISDDEIKEGDWFIHHSHGTTTLLKAIDVKDRIFDNQGTSCCKSYCKKIIATTDTSLNLPQPSQQFIQKFIEDYNKGNVITDVLVEYQTDFKSETKLYMLSMGDNLDDFKYGESTIKINPKDNTITIKKVKDNWNREEVKSLLLQLVKDCGDDESLYHHYNGKYIDLNKWIEENL